MQSEKLFLRDIESSYATKFTASVIETTEQSVSLDRTLFYPLGGGQLADTGMIEGPNGQLRVEQVTGRNLIEHFVGPDHQLEVGDEVRGEIDWQRRYEHMRMHTAQHLVSGIVYEEFDGARTVGNQINAEKSRIDFNPISFDDEKLELVKQKFAEIIAGNEKVEQVTMSRDEINAIMPPERTNMDLLPSSVKQLRVIKIGDNLDLCPCAGTHISSLSELGELTWLGKKSKGKGTQRVTYSLAKGLAERSPTDVIL